MARRTAALEAALGTPLFIRGPRGYGLSPAGDSVLQEARVMQHAALAVRDASDHGAVRGLVRLTTTRGLAEGFLARHMAGLFVTHPDIDVEILADLRVQSLTRHEADLAIRLGRPKDSQLVGRKLGSFTLGFYASRQPSHLAEPPNLVGYDEASDYVAEATWLATHFPDSRVVVRSNSQTVQLEVARSGAGIALLPAYAVKGERTLQPVNLGIAPPEREVWLLMRRDAQRIPRIRTVADYVARVFAEAWPEANRRPRAERRRKQGRATVRRTR